MTTAPPTSGLTATTAAGDAPRASRIPGTARMGPIEITGFDGPITIARAAAIASSTSGAGRDASTPSSSTPSTGSPAPARIMYSWKGHQRPSKRTRVRTASSLMGRTLASSSPSVSTRGPSIRRASGRRTGRSGRVPTTITPARSTRAAAPVVAASTPMRAVRGLTSSNAASVRAGERVIRAVRAA